MNNLNDAPKPNAEDFNPQSGSSVFAEDNVFAGLPIYDDLNQLDEEVEETIGCFAGWSSRLEKFVFNEVHWELTPLPYLKDRTKRFFVNEIVQKSFLERQLRWLRQSLVHQEMRYSQDCSIEVQKVRAPRISEMMVGVQELEMTYKTPEIIDDFFTLSIREVSQPGYNAFVRASVGGLITKNGEQYDFACGSTSVACFFREAKFTDWVAIQKYVLARGEKLSKEIRSSGKDAEPAAFAIIRKNFFCE